MKYTLAVLALLLIFTVSSYAQIDDGIPDTIRVDSVVSFTTADGILPIHMFTDKEISGLEITLKASTNEVQIDSFVFQDTYAFADFTFNPDKSIITIFAFDAIMPGNIKLGDLHLSYAQSITPQLVVIDTITFADGQNIRSTSFSDTNFVSFIPQFKKGYLDIQPIPPEFDSIWFDDYSTSPGESFFVDVNFFNDEEIIDFTLALDYADVNLQYDSVSLITARPVPFPLNSPIVQNQSSSHQLLFQLEFDTANALQPGTGSIARLYFTVDQNSPEMMLTLDTTSFAGLISTTVQHKNEFPFTPIVRTGTVDIKISTDVRDITGGDNLPTSFALEQNYPNPFNPTTNIEFSLPKASHVEIIVFNVLGQSVRNLVNQELSAGRHEVSFDSRGNNGQTLASGVYFYRMITEDFIESKKMLLIK